MTSPRPLWKFAGGTVLVALLAGLMVLCFSPVFRPATSVVLLPGLAWDTSRWRESGLVDLLVENGFHSGGTWRRDVVGEVSGANPQARRRWDDLFYLVEWPDETAGIESRVDWLEEALAATKRPWRWRERVALVGYSVGGVVGRAYLVRHAQNPGRVSVLITAASPHHGLPAADIVDVLELPQRLLRDWLGEDSPPLFTVAILKDLQPEESGNYLDILNRRRHPTAVRYVSIIKRAHGESDWLVPESSQEMGTLVAFQAQGLRSETHKVTGDHLRLSPEERQLWQELLPKLRSYLQPPFLHWVLEEIREVFSSHGGRAAPQPSST